MNGGPFRHLNRVTGNALALLDREMIRFGMSHGTPPPHLCAGAGGFDPAHARQTAGDTPHISAQSPIEGSRRFHTPVPILNEREDPATPVAGASAERLRRPQTEAGALVRLGAGDGPGLTSAGAGASGGGAPGRRDRSGRERGSSLHVRPVPVRSGTAAESLPRAAETAA